MDKATKDKFKEEFGPNLIFEGNEQDGIDRAAKHMQAFVLSRITKLENCTHEPESNIFPLDERLIHYKCYCGKTEYIQMTQACHDEILIDPDLRNFPNHKVHQGKLLEIFGLKIIIIK